MAQLESRLSQGPFDVICAKGNEAKNHAENRHFRSRVKQYLDNYACADSKVAISITVNEIIDSVRKLSPFGGFAKQMEDGLWYEVEDHSAREKVRQSLRDLLYMQYKSSSKAKRTNGIEMPKSSNGKCFKS